MRLLAALDFGLTHESVVATARALAPPWARRPTWST